MRTSETRFCIVAFVILFVVGCSSEGEISRPAVVPVTGKVVYDGKPVEGADVVFWAEGAPRAAAGRTNAQGEFQLTMFEPNDGAIPGENVVTVSKTAASTTDMYGGADTTKVKPEDLARLAQEQAENKGMEPGKGTAPKSELPEKYRKRDTSPLKKTVSKDGPNHITIEL